MIKKYEKWNKILYFFVTFKKNDLYHVQLNYGLYNIM